MVDLRLPGAPGQREGLRGSGSLSRLALRETKTLRGAKSDSLNFGRPYSVSAILVRDSLAIYRREGLPQLHHMLPGRRKLVSVGAERHAHAPLIQYQQRYPAGSVPEPDRPI